MKIVNVQFNGSSRNYAYLTDIEDISPGDLVVVDSPHDGFVCVVVCDTKEDAESIEKATKWIVDRVDVKGYHERIKREEKRKALIAKLRKVQERVLEVNQLAALAEISPEAKALVEELKSIG